MAFSKLPPEVTNRVVKPADNAFSVYVNDVQLQMSPWDLRLLLGVVTGLPTDDPHTITVTQLGEIRIAPQLAKKLMLLMMQQVQAYEAQLGPIPLPPD
jgi:hypothetical protein